MIFLATPHVAPTGEKRQAAFQRMDEILGKAAENMQNIPDAEFNEAADEAMDSIRKRAD